MIGKSLSIVCLIATVIAFRAIFPQLWTAWQTDEYSHGIIIPLIAALLGWHILTRAPPIVSPTWFGPATLIVSGFLLLVGTLAAFTTVAEYGFIVSIIGFCLSYFGRQAALILAPAFLYLVFAIPLPHLTYATLSQDLQLLSSTIGVRILDALGIPVFQEGNVIDLGGMKLQVVEACSGLRYLFPLMSFGYLVAYLLKDHVWKRVVIFLSTIPITILTNSLRIALIGVTVDIWGNDMAGGLVHVIEGWVIFLVCITMLMGEVRLLIGPGGHFRFDYLGMTRGPLMLGSIKPSAPGMAALVLAIIIIFGMRLVDDRSQIIVPHPAFSGFPLKLDDWNGTEQALEPDILNGLQLSDYWLADYHRGENGAPVDFYMAYYNTQRVGSATHSPANCIPGGGWQIADGQVKTIPVAGALLRVSRLVIRKGDAAETVYYWFDERGRDLTETISAKWYTMIDAVTMKRTDGALIRVSTPIVAGDSEENTDRRLTEFLTVAYPQIGRFVPGAPQ